MKILSDIESVFSGIETHIAHLFELRKQHIETEAGQALARIDSRIERLKEWLGSIKKEL